MPDVTPSFPVITRRQARLIDRLAQDELHIPSLVLMENAGLNAAAAMLDWLAADAGIEPAEAQVAVVCGGGNNGGDGYVIARHMSLWGAAVTLWSATDPRKLTGDAKINHDICAAMGLPIHPLFEADALALAVKAGFSAPETWLGDAPDTTFRGTSGGLPVAHGRAGATSGGLPVAHGRAGATSGGLPVAHDRAGATSRGGVRVGGAGVDLMVDALLGTGFTGTVRPHLAAVIDAINDAPGGPGASGTSGGGGRVAAVDIPSGLDCDTGRPGGVAITADLTVTFIAHKPGFGTRRARPYVGKVVLAEIGTPPQLLERVLAAVDGFLEEAGPGGGP